MKPKKQIKKIKRKSNATKVVEAIINKTKNKTKIKLEVPIYRESDYSYVRISEIPEQYKEEFSKWLRGQTCPLPIYPLFPTTRLERFLYRCFGLVKATMIKDAIYSWDWERWYNSKTKGVPTYFD